MGFINDTKNLSNLIKDTEKKLENLDESISSQTKEVAKSDEFIDLVLKEIKSSSDFSELTGMMKKFNEDKEEIKNLTAPESLKRIINDSIKEVLDSDDFVSKVASSISNDFKEYIQKDIKTSINNILNNYDLGIEIDKRLQKKANDYAKEAFENLTDLRFQAQLSVIALNLALKLFLFKDYMPSNRRHFQKRIVNE